MVATKMDQFERLGAHDEGREAGRPLDEKEFFGHFSTALLLKYQRAVLASDIPKRRTLSTKTRIASHSRILTSAGI